MSKRKFGFEITKQPTYTFEHPHPQQKPRLFVPSSSSHDHYEDTDLDNIDYAEPNTENHAQNPEPDEIDPLDAFMEGIHEEMKIAPKAKAKAEDKYLDEDDDPMDSYLKMKKDVGLTLASDALNAGYNSDEEVYAAAKAVDAGLLEYDEDDNPIVVDRKRIEPIAALDHSGIDYEAFNKDFYDEKPSVSGICD